MTGFEFGSWYGLWGPKDLPADITAKLQAEVAKVLAQPDVQERLATLGFEPIGSTPEAFAKYIASEMEKYGKIIHDRQHNSRVAKRHNRLNYVSAWRRSFQPSCLPVQVLGKTLADGGAELPEREAVEREFQHHVHEAER